MDTRPAWAEIDLAAVSHNLKELRRIIRPDAKIMAVVKANAYGHGAVPVSRTVLKNGADYLGVAILSEVRQLREADINAPILILGYTPAEQVTDVIRLEAAQTVFDCAAAEAISQVAVKLGKKARIHVKVDTGLGRLGFPADAGTAQEILRISRLPGVEVEGLFTHFSVAGSKNKDYTYWQYARFKELVTRLTDMGLDIPIKHVANSAAVIDLPDVQLDMVRVGVSIYGLYPSDEILKNKVKLIPALTWKAQVVQVKAVPAQSSISYGRTFITDKETKVATIPVGYADGYSRLLSNRAHVIIHGQRVPVIGTVCMDQFMVDVSGAPDVRAGDEVILIGRQGSQQVTADELAELMGTINYEIVCMVGSRIPRIHIN